MLNEKTWKAMAHQGHKEVTEKRDALHRAAHFAPAEGNERAAYYIYQISNTVLFLYLFCLTVKLKLSWQLCFGIVFYFAGLCLCAVSVVNFAFPDDTGLNTNGVYRLSRNPIYVAYFIYFEEYWKTETEAFI